MSAVVQPGQRIPEREFAQAIDQTLQVDGVRFAGLLLNILRIVLKQGAGVFELQVLQLDQ